MLWPIILPIKIAFWALTAAVVAATILAPSLNWHRGKTFLISLSLAVIAFVPSCIGIMFAVDGIRFGKFEYTTFDEVDDFRAERYLPIAARNITMHKHANGYRARYVISNTDFHADLDYLWHESGEKSAFERGKLWGEGSPVTKEEQNRVFSELGWEPLENAIKYYSPREADGGGATYYYDSVAGVAMQRTGYW